jgi:hypothetical protein
MGGRKSRNKGASFERAIATRLREWLGDEWEIKRNPTDRQKGKAGAGEFEIVGPREFPFAIECKAHESFSCEQLFRVPITGPFSGFWDQANSQARAARKWPMLILKRNNGPVLCAMDPEAAISLIPSPERAPCLTVHSPRCCVVPLQVVLDEPASRLFELRWK